MSNFYKKLTRSLQNSWQLYVFLIPAALFIIVFRYGPMYGLQLAFKSYNPRLGITGSHWIGFDHFVRFFSYYRFGEILLNTLLLSLYKLVAGFPIPILLALALNELKNLKVKKTLQTIVYAPYFVSVVVVVGIVTQLLSPHFGPVGVLVNSLRGNQVDLMANPAAFRHLFVWTDVWQLSGYSAILYIAALSSISPELYEAAEIDGAGKFQRLVNIDIPALIPTAVILLILEMGRIMDISFEKVILLQNSLNLRTSEVLTTYIYKTGLLEGNFDFATAGGLVVAVINFALVVSVNKIARKFGETSLW
jgi:putative aldouronate transport system permease protein